MQEKELTGFPSIDKPWLKYYSEEAINTPLAEAFMTISGMKIRVISIFQGITECGNCKDQ